MLVLLVVASFISCAVIWFAGLSRLAFSPSAFKSFGLAWIGIGAIFVAMGVAASGLTAWQQVWVGVAQAAAMVLMVRQLGRGLRSASTSRATRLQI